MKTKQKSNQSDFVSRSSLSLVDLFHALSPHPLHALLPPPPATPNITTHKTLQHITEEEALVDFELADDTYARAK